MPRTARPADTSLARIRAYYGLTLRHLSMYLGISETLTHHYETARRYPSRAVLERLNPLREQMRSGPDEVPLPTTPPPGPLDPKPLEARRDACLHRARNLRYSLRQLPERAQQAARWALALPALKAALPPADAPAPAAHDLPAQYEAIHLTYVRGFLDLQPTALDPEVLSQWHLLRLRAEALEAEAAALATLLAQLASEGEA